MDKNEVTIVMYHYVRPLERSRYPSIKGLRVSEFKQQLAYIRHAYTPITVADMVACLRCGEPLPPRAVLLTFDDGYSDHFSYVFPLLDDFGIQGAFFPPVAPIRDRELLDVNCVHFILAAVEDQTLLIEEINRDVRKYQSEFCLKTPEEYWRELGKAWRYDTAEVIYVKRMLQVALPESARRRITLRLFETFVSRDRTTFAEELYMSIDQLKLMQRSGMYVGSHGASHHWLNSVDATFQRNEIETSLQFLKEIGSPVHDYWVMCYPYGASDESLRNLLIESQCAFGLTTQVAVADLAKDNPLLLPRIDTNELPKQFAQMGGDVDGTVA
jgi:peptidoglycan/xylan/chitin deacetylase (PgdA/CDA1 family)